MSYVAWFKDLNKDSIATAGGKGANLAEMINAGLPVPNGFAVTAQTYKEFIEKTGIKDKILAQLFGLNVDDTAKLQEVAKQIQKIITDTEIPEEIKEEIIDNYELLGAEKEAHDLIEAKEVFVAVRSSATAEDLPEFSFAGQQATYLNVRKTDHVVQAVQQCWASLYTARAIYYRVKNNFEHSKVYIAVVIQKMVESEKAGVMFSMNPATNNKDEIIIEAGFGFGDAVVSGAISPDSYVVDKNTFEIKNKTVGNKEFMFYRDPNTGRTNKRILSLEKARAQVLTDDEVKRIAKLAKKSEDHYGNPQDMEFAIEGNNLFMVQTRAITTQDKVSEAVASSEKIEVKEGEEILTGISASPGVGKGTVKIVKDANDLSKIQKGDVLVAKMTNPDYVAAMQKASAIVTDEGGSTCHAAIVSREMGIPSVVGTQEATAKLKEGQMITVDGTNGKVYSGDKSIAGSENNNVEKEAPVVCNEKTVTKVKVIVDMPDFVDRAAMTGADGVGLLRAEFMILEGKVHPAYLVEQGRRQELIDNLYSKIKKIAEAFKDKPIWYRTLDMRSDEYSNLEGGNAEHKEDNPMMGWHGIRRDLDQPDLLRAQLEAIKKVKDDGFDNVGIMIPLVTHIEQIRLTKAMLKEMEMHDVEFGIMVETPASVQLIEEFCKEGINFASIGSNDLTQFTLAVDRNNAKVQKIYNAKHPAVMKEIKHVIRTCKRYRVKSSLCGQAGSDPEMAQELVNMGIDSIAVNIDAVGKVRQAVADEEKKLLLDAARQ